MPPSDEKVYHVLSKPWFFQPNHTTAASISEEHLHQAAKVIAKGKLLLMYVQDKVVKEHIYDIMSQTEQILRLLNQFGDNPNEVESDYLLMECQRLQRALLLLPAGASSTERKAGDINYKIAAVCLYLLAISFCLTVGATFGAWYFGFLTATYFTDTLVAALSAVGIPAACLGLFSFGLYKAQRLSQEHDSTLNDTTLEEDGIALCDLIIEHYELNNEPASGSLLRY